VGSEKGAFDLPLAARHSSLQFEEEVSHMKKELSKSWRYALAVTALAAAFGVLPPNVFGQIATGSVSGTVTDPSSAVVPRAKVGLTTVSTGATIYTTTDSKGFFSFPLVQPATYNVSVIAKGFKAWEAKGIVVNQGESRTLSKIVLEVGATAQTVTVSAGVALAPVSTGESSETLNNTMVSQLAIVGRDAAELIKIMPGMEMDNGGLSQRPSFSDLTTQTNTGPIGAFSANGTQPYGGMQMTLNGGVLVDTGNQGTQIANVDQDMVQSMTIRNSDFSSQYSQGPVIMSFISKSGGDQYHGEVYLYGRNGSLNSEDSFLKAEGLAKPIDHEWYPGGNIGGPVPHTHKKLFFFSGFEYMNQLPAGSLTQVFTPTPAMRSGDFSASELAPQATTGWQTAAVPCTNTTYFNYANFCKGAVASGQIVNGIISPSLFDPNGSKYMNLFPMPNENPSDHGGYNFDYLDHEPVNRYELYERGDYDLNDKNTMYLSYDRQHEIDDYPLGNPWWAPPGSVPYPSPLSTIQITDLWSASYNHIFTPTLTNQATFNWTSFINPLRAENPSAVTPSAVGLTEQLPFTSTGAAAQMPNIFSYGTWGPGSMPMFFAMGQPSGFDGGAFGALKRVPSLADNLAWVKGGHTIMAGVYYEQAGNEQTDAAWGSNEGFPQGSYEFEQYAYYGSYNPMADILLGHPDTFNQYSDAPTFDMWYRVVAPFIQDQWKVSRNITLNYGMRFDHMGQWYPSGTNGDMVWDPSTCPASTTPGPKCVGNDLPGFEWHSRDSSVPNSGFSTPAFYYEPRLGIADDLFGNGKFVLRGGFGIYHYEFAYNDTSEGLSSPLGIQSFTTTCPLSSWTAISTAACLPTSKTGALPASSTGLSETADMYGDNKMPYTEDWDVALDVRAPWNSLVELMYVGNRSRDELVADALSDVDDEAPGAYFLPDPVSGVTYCQTPYFAPAGCSTTGFTGTVQDQYLPYNYSGIDVLTHGSYANYNGLQIEWQKQAGPAVFMVNYTWSHVMGIRDGETDNGNGNGVLVDPYCLQCNYGVLDYNRAQIFNAGYVLNLPKPIHNEAFLKGLVNGWELSGITQYQTGNPIQPYEGGNLNLTYGGGLSASNWLGDNVETLMPALSCNPASGLASGQYFNPKCFAPPTRLGLGQNGPIVWPNIVGPGYFDWDLALYKNFHVTERQGLQFRVDAFNFLNHPNSDFTLDPADYDMSFETSSSALSQTNTNSLLTGKPLYTDGNRNLEFTIKYSF
jgi:hypothetical protein